MELTEKFASTSRKIEFQFVSCPLCGVDDCQPAYIRADEGSVVRCGRCGLLYLNPRPLDASIVSFYDESYFTNNGHGSAYKDYVSMQGVALKHREHPGFLALHVIERYVAPRGKRLLDIGCAGGHLLHVARRRGFIVMGVDISPYAAAQAKRSFGVDVFAGSLGQADFEGASFDVVTALEVIEHLIDPVEWLREIHRILKPGGLVLLSTPNGGCAGKFGERWRGFTTSFEHLTFFDESTLNKALAMVSLESLGAWTRGNGMDFGLRSSRSFKAVIKKGGKHLLSILPPVLSLVNGWRQTRSLASSHERPSGHTIWVLARKQMPFAHAARHVREAPTP